ncbi:hypothetical protein H4O18_12220 [Arenibacter sp. BSSL-BM3]|uniref:DUF4129 domain-containing protein n=1 Tax=Arenibacter arenosicollis TaxID=2762274 RepID=A0ABR7QNJ3_9FLAO|nr:hypothetical protein [Arenibacter arenosicollis]MBC8768760.1 hypothetical protein [Arenibacter arenosicollis]
MIKINFTICSFFVLFSGSAQGEKDSITLNEDRGGNLVIRSLDENLAQKYQGKEFNYSIKDGESQNLLARFLNWLMNGLKDVFGIDLPPGITQILEYLIYYLMGALAIYLLVRFLTGESASAIFRKKATSFTNINLAEEHIESLDLDVLVNDAIKQRNYRLAIRYQYLKVLKTLSQQQIIEWHYEKTNQDYEKEIKVPAIKLLFKDVSYLYDHIWYGEQEIDEHKYMAAQMKFTNLNNIGSNG